MKIVDKHIDPALDLDRLSRVDRLRVQWALDDARRKGYEGGYRDGYRNGRNDTLEERER